MCPAADRQGKGEGRRRKRRREGGGERRRGRGGVTVRKARDMATKQQIICSLPGVFQ